MSTSNPNIDDRISSPRRINSSRVRSDPRFHLQISKEYFFLTIPGVIRLLEMLLAGLNLISFAYYCTYYDKTYEDALPPVLLANTREAFFLIANSQTFVTALSVIISSVVSLKSHSALLGSLFLFIFDFTQLILLLAASVGLILLYNDLQAKVVYGATLQTRQGISVTGVLLACLHLIGCIYGLAIYIRRTESVSHIIDSPAQRLSTSSSRRPGSRERIVT